MYSSSHSHTSVRPGEPCPDPAIHNALQKDKKLQNAASRSALYGDESSMDSRQNIFGPDGKLTAASAAASLRYAKPHELPSYPSVGIDTGSANRAANLAGNVNKRDWWQPQSTENGQSAARLAFSKNLTVAKMGYSLPEGERHGAMLAATNLAKPGSDRIGSSAMEASRVKNINMSREMFTEHPPLKIEVEEQRRQDALKASTAVLAKQLYNLELNKNAPAAGAKPTYPGLKEHAQQLAAERLAKLDPDGVMAYREHYGYGIAPGRSSLTTRSTTGPPDAADAAQARKIRGQMGQFNNQLADIDEQKRQKDREILMAAAEKRVQARMTAMDEKVFMDTGKMTPAVSAEWEAQAKAKAEANAEGRQQNVRGKVHIGGGKFMDMSEIEAIAAARMQPTLDEITETAAAQRQRDEEIRVATEERRKQEMEERAITQQKKDEERMKAFQEKNELREKNAIEKAERDKVRAEEKAERNRVRDAERLKQNQIRMEQKQKEAEERAERNKIQAEEKAERDRVRAEQKVESDRIKAEQKVENERIKAEEKAEREKLKAQEKEEQLAREEAQKEKDLKFKEEQAAAKVTDKDEEVIETTTTREEFTDAQSEAETAIKVGEAPDTTKGVALGEAGTTTLDVDETEEIRADDTLLANETAADVAARVLGAPIEEETEGETTMTTTTETIPEKVAHDEALGGIRDPSGVKLGNFTSKWRIPGSSSDKPSGSRRASFFNRVKKLSRSISSKDKVPGVATTNTEDSTIVGTKGDGVDEVEGAAATTESAVVDTTDGTVAKHEAVDKTDAASEGGLYSEPSEDPTERPNGDLADHEDETETISAYETDEGTRPRRSEETGDETGDERFVEARDHLESGLTTPMETSARKSLDDGNSTSKFQEAL